MWVISPLLMGPSQGPDTLWTYRPSPWVDPAGNRGLRKSPAGPAGSHGAGGKQHPWSGHAGSPVPTPWHPSSLALRFLLAPTPRPLGPWCSLRLFLGLWKTLLCRPGPNGPAELLLPNGLTFLLHQANQWPKTTGRNGSVRVLAAARPWEGLSSSGRTAWTWGSGLLRPAELAGGPARCVLLGPEGKGGHRMATHPITSGWGLFTPQVPPVTPLGMCHSPRSPRALRPWRPCMFQPLICCPAAWRGRVSGSPVCFPKARA